MSKAVYFPGLNTVRLYAALCVVVAHTVYAFEDVAFYGALLGGNAVTLFFVLSGFLIGYLLLGEKRDTRTINVTRFYKRRALRILPLYFLIVLVGYGLPFIRPESWTLPFSLFFIVPVPWAMIGNPMGYLGHLWSIGVEELFYFFIPVALRRSPVVAVCLVIIGARIIIMADVPTTEGDVLYRILHAYRFECMAVGVLAAWLYRDHKDAMRVVYHPVVAWTMFGMFVLLNFNIVAGDALQQSVVFAILLLNIGTNPKFPSFEHPLLSWWGKRTYGIYMWHFPVIGLLVAAMPDIDGVSGTVITFVLTFLITAISYEWFEKLFLQRKQARHIPQPSPITT